MPLSEHEQRLLDQIERGLYAEDPKFVQTVQATDPRKHYKRRMIKAAFGFVAGVCLLMAGVLVAGMGAGQAFLAVALLGFVVMLVSCVWGLSSWKHMAGIGNEKPTQSKPDQSRQPRFKSSPKPHTPRPQRQQHQQRGGKFMERMEERWRKRRENGH